MMDEFENNRENEHVDQTPHAETPYDTGDGNTDNLKRTEQQTEQNAEHRQEDAYTQAQQYGSTYYGDMRTQEYMQAMAERAQQMSQGTEHYYNNNYQQPNQNAYNYGQNNYYQNGFQNADAEQPKAKVKKAKKLLVSQIRIGDEVRQIVSGIAAYYKPEEMVGKKVAVVTNLKPCKLCGVESQGMILAAADDENNLSVLTVDKDIIEGSEIR